VFGGSKSTGRTMRRERTVDDSNSFYSFSHPRLLLFLLAYLSLCKSGGSLALDGRACAARIALVVNVRDGSRPHEDGEEEGLGVK
jgi:hypothetical protein